MKVAIISNNYIPFIGGAEIFAIELAEFLEKKGHEVDIITLKHENEIPDFEIINGVNVYRTNYMKTKGLGFISSTIAMLRTLLRLDKEKSYDFVHSIAESPTSQVCTIFKIIRKKPHLITIQGGHLSKGDLDFGLENKILKKIIGWSFRNADAVHTISFALSEESKRLGAKNVVILPNGVNEDMIQYTLKEKRRKEQGIGSNEKVIISVSRLVALKGIKFVIMAFSKIIQKYPNSRLIIVGDGNQRKNLEKLSHELNIKDNVEFKGFIPHNEIVKILTAADVFAVTPEYEGLGIVFIEALACGVPVVATKVGGILDIIEDGKNGLFVPHGDVNKLYESIDYLLSDKEKQEEFRKNGIDTVKEKFLWNNILSSIEKLYLR